MHACMQDPFLDVHPKPQWNGLGRKCPRLASWRALGLTKLNVLFTMFKWSKTWNSAASFNTSSLKVFRLMCVTGYCSAKQVTSVCPNTALQAIAAPLCAILTTATTTASARTTRASNQCVGKNTQTVIPHRSGKMCSSMCLFSVSSQLPRRRGLLVHGPKVWREDDSGTARGRVSGHLAHHGDCDRRFGLRGSATLPSHVDPGKSRPNSEQVHTALVTFLTLS